MNTNKFNKNQKCRIIRRSIILGFLGMMLLTTFVAFTYAYFTKIDIYNATLGISVGDNLFDRLNADALNTYQTTVLGGTANPDASWGSKENPYVISEVKHLNNLSALQNIGYFKKNYIDKNTFTDGVYTSGNLMPHFLVCKNDGTPVTIVGGNTPIEPIGNEDYPFIGTVNGAFVTGDTNKTQINNSLYSDTSTIYDVEVLSSESSVDVGLFGHISCLGTPSTDNTAFAGIISEVSNLLLYDVSVKVDDSLWSTWTAIVDHMFSYSGITTNTNSVPHETHHIGIVTGHVTYSKMENISVYYSSGDVSAIDLSHTTKTSSLIEGVTYNVNYMSTTGFIGYLDGMNPKVNDDGTIQPNTGSGNSGLIFGAGEGGGGLMSGNYTGYVVAQRVLEVYKYDDNGNIPPVVLYPDAYDDPTNNNDEPVETPVYIKGLYAYITTELDENGNEVAVTPYYKPLCENASEEGETEKYYFRDGVFTFALSQGGTDTIQPTWWKLDDYGKPIETFQVGENDSSKWESISATSPDSVLAYVRQVTSSKELSDAITVGKQVFILNETINEALEEKLFLMSLYETSKGESGNNNPNSKYYTEGIAKNFATAEQIQTYIDSYNNGIWKLPTMKNDLSYTVPTTSTGMETALTSGKLKPIFLGSGTSSTTIETILNQFAIDVVARNDVNTYLEKDTNTPVLLNDLGQAIEYFNYEDAIDNTGTNVKGYIICEYIHQTYGLGNIGNRDYYRYYWQPLTEGAEPELITAVFNGTDYDELSFNASNDDTTNPGVDNPTLATFYGYGTNVKTATNDQPVTLSTFKIETKTGTELEVTASIIHRTREDKLNAFAETTKGEFGPYTLYNDSTNSAIAIEMTDKAFKIKMDEPINAWIYDVSANTWFWNSSALDSKPSINKKDGELTPGSKLQFYVDENDNIGIVINKYPTYEFKGPNSNDGEENYLRILTMVYNLGVFSSFTSTSYPLWVGSKNEIAEENYPNFAITSGGSSKSPTSIESSTAATVIFESDGSVTISFSEASAGQIRYVDYSTSQNSDGSILQKFGSSASKPDVTTDKLYIYVLEGTENSAAEDTRRAIVPTENSTQGEYNPSEYVLFASTAQNVTDFDNYTYQVTYLNSLGWKDGTGYTLGDGSEKANSALHKKFCVTEGINFNLQINLGNFFTYNTPGMITAPIGSNGQRANIPQGCIAFRKNSTTTEEINVIVAVPITELYIGENGTVNVAAERYFNLWKSEEAGSSIIQISDPDDTVDRFVLPHSNPYNKEETDKSRSEWDTNSALNYILVTADLDNDGVIDTENVDTDGDGIPDTTRNKQYRSYLNGDRVLVAYSFSVTDEGVYIMGASGKNSVGETVSVPMEIVYFSAPSAASAGADGVPNSQLGSIDFVYANDTDVLTVKEVTEKPADLTTGYYPSYSFFYFDSRLNDSSGFIAIREGKVYVMRTTTTSQSTITWKRVMSDSLVTQYGEPYIKFNQYVTGEQLTETTG